MTIKFTGMWNFKVLSYTDQKSITFQMSLTSAGKHMGWWRLKTRLWASSCHSSKTKVPLFFLNKEYYSETMGLSLSTTSEFPRYSHHLLHLVLDITHLLSQSSRFVCQSLSWLIEIWQKPNFTKTIQLLSKNKVLRWFFTCIWWF